MDWWPSYGKTILFWMREVHIPLWGLDVTAALLERKWWIPSKTNMELVWEKRHSSEWLSIAIPKFDDSYLLILIDIDWSYDHHFSGFQWPIYCWWIGESPFFRSSHHISMIWADRPTNWTGELSQGARLLALPPSTARNTTGSTRSHLEKWWKMHMNFIQCRMMQHGQHVFWMVLVWDT